VPNPVGVTTHVPVTVSVPKDEVITFPVAITSAIPVATAVTKV
jgi:hypothetical protein